jgi:FMN phosphatase YigB (HAD superfamily)
MILAFDFDRTLFDTDADVVAMTSQGVADRIGDPYVNTIVDPTPFLYPDTIPFLESYNRRCLYVVSAITARYGPLAEAYQKDKIARTGVEAHVSEVLLTGDSKVAALSSLVEKHRGEQVVFIDDKTDVILEVYEALPEVVCIHMVRAGAKRMSETSLPGRIPVVHSLAECATELSRYG